MDREDVRKLFVEMTGPEGAAVGDARELGRHSHALARALHGSVEHEIGSQLETDRARVVLFRGVFKDGTGRQHGQLLQFA